MKTAMVLSLVAWFSIPAPANTARDIRHDLDQYMQRITARGFSGAILVAKDGRVILSKGYGKLGPRGGSVTADTVFDLASVTKQLTAGAILKLEMQGKLTTGDPVSKYLAGVPKDKEDITIHHLLTHTAGWCLLVRDMSDFKMASPVIFCLLSRRSSEEESACLYSPIRASFLTVSLSPLTIGRSCTADSALFRPNDKALILI